MLIEVEEDHSGTSTVRAVNALHAPAVGTVVVHAPYGCPLREFAIEVLHALDRPPAPEARTADLAAWATAWLTTAAPRCDLLVYGARRLAATSQRWLRELAEHPNVTVWRINDPDELRRDTAYDAGSPAVWRWQTFLTRPWRHPGPHHHAELTLCGRPCPPSWQQDDPPPFPWTRRRIAALPTPSAEYAAVVQLTLTYEAVSPTIERTIGTPDLEARGVTAAVAYLALIARSALDLAIFLRHLEEDVFLRRGLLIADPQRIAARVASLDAEGQLGTSHRSATEHNCDADPRRAVEDLVSRLRPSERREFEASRMISAATDGTTLTNGAGTVLHVPPWWNWPVRAAARVRQLSPTTPSIAALTTKSRLTSYQAIEVLGRPASESLHATLAPAIDAIAPDVTLHTLPDPGANIPAAATADGTGDSDDLPPLTPAAAHRLHELYEQRSERLYHHEHLPPDDPGIEWLIAHDLADHHPERGNTTIVPWLYDTMYARLRAPFNAEDRLPRRFI